MAKNREQRDTGISKSVNMLEPLDITKFGTDEDPCFGKHYDLVSSECKECGDSSICQVVMSQNTLIKQKQPGIGQPESINQNHSNLTRSQINSINRFIDRRLDRNIPTIKLISQVVTKYGDIISKDKAKSMVKLQKHKLK